MNERGREKKGKEKRRMDEGNDETKS